MIIKFLDLVLNTYFYVKLFKNIVQFHDLLSEIDTLKVTIKVYLGLNSFCPRQRQARTFFATFRQKHLQN